MKTKLKDFLTILSGEISEDSPLSSPIERLCEIMTYISGEKCEPDDLNIQIRSLYFANPGWYANLRIMVDAFGSTIPDIDVELGKLEKKRGGARVGSGAKKKEPRKSLFKSVPVSLYAEIKKMVDDKVRAYVKTEAERMAVIANTPPAIPPCPDFLPKYKAQYKWDSLNPDEKRGVEKMLRMSVRTACTRWAKDNGVDYVEPVINL